MRTKYFLSAIFGLLFFFVSNLARAGSMIVVFDEFPDYEQQEFYQIIRDKAAEYTDLEIITGPEIQALFNSYERETPWAGAFATENDCDLLLRLRVPGTYVDKANFNTGPHWGYQNVPLYDTSVDMVGYICDGNETKYNLCSAGGRGKWNRDMEAPIYEAFESALDKIFWDFRKGGSFDLSTYGKPREKLYIPPSDEPQLCSAPLGPYVP